MRLRVGDAAGNVPVPTREASSATVLAEENEPSTDQRRRKGASAGLPGAERSLTRRRRVEWMRMAMDAITASYEQAVRRRFGAAGDAFLRGLPEVTAA